MTKRECFLLVLSPQARSGDQARKFRPFGGRTLVDLMRDVAVALSHRRSRRFYRNAIFPGFFFGTTTFDDSLVRDLRRMGSALVDCRTLISDEAAAVVAGQKALSFLAEDLPDTPKWILLTCNDGCGTEMSLPFDRAESDEALRAHLWLDLCGGASRRIGQAMARRWSA
jgi:hypothetical protein